jgi:hypothetical protein
MPQEENRRGQAWPSPRTWDYFSRLLAEWKCSAAKDDDLIAMAAGCLGDGVAREFVIWHRELDLPDPEELIANPSAYRHPNRGDQAYAVLSAIVQAVLADLTEVRWSNAWKILADAAGKGSPDVAAAPARNLARAYEPSLCIPEKEVSIFVPLLKAAGLLPSKERKGVKDKRKKAPARPQASHSARA